MRGVLNTRELLLTWAYLRRDFVLKDVESLYINVGLCWPLPDKELFAVLESSCAVHLWRSVLSLNSEGENHWNSFSLNTITWFQVTQFFSLAVMMLSVKKKTALPYSKVLGQEGVGSILHFWLQAFWWRKKCALGS